MFVKLNEKTFSWGFSEMKGETGTLVRFSIIEKSFYGKF
jgi:hypothetical protein